MIYDPGFDQVRESQQVFRQLLDATAWPGKIAQLPASRVTPPLPWPAAVAQIAQTLLDVQVTFSVHGADGEALTDYLLTNTGARTAPLESASYVIAGPPAIGLDVHALYPGTLPEPDRGATLLLACDYLADDVSRSSPSVDQNGALHHEHSSSDHDVTVLSLRGRGIAGRQALAIDRDTATLMERLAERGIEYPLGVDLILADRAGHIVSLPRTTRWSKETIRWDT
jgi:alpha-D-ribose 1-methylphosphonate 5-triphosphate synthase subunit PhnH